jgi:hypothetical protein
VSARLRAPASASARASEQASVRASHLTACSITPMASKILPHGLHGLHTSRKPTSHSRTGRAAPTVPHYRSGIAWQCLSRHISAIATNCVLIIHQSIFYNVPTPSLCVYLYYYP